MRQRGAEAEPSMRQRLRIVILHQRFAIDNVAHHAIDALQTDVIPMVGTKEMVGVSVFLEDFGLRIETVIATETRSTVVVATIAHIVEAQRIAVLEDAASLTHTRPDAASRSTGVGGHPEAVEVGEAISAVTLHHHGIVLYYQVTAQLVLVPQRQAFGRPYLCLAILPLHTAHRILCLHHPIGGRGREQNSITNRSSGYFTRKKRKKKKQYSCEPICSAAPFHFNAVCHSDAFPIAEDGA